MMKPEPSDWPSRYCGSCCAPPRWPVVQLCEDNASTSGKAGLELLRRSSDEAFTAHFNDERGSPLLRLRGFATFDNLASWLLGCLFGRRCLALLFSRRWRRCFGSLRALLVRRRSHLRLGSRRLFGWRFRFDGNLCWCLRLDLGFRLLGWRHLRFESRRRFRLLGRNLDFRLDPSCPIK